ncbi:MAG: Rad52/Rad22 family DNA repair protein [Pseudolabrys sp.]|nr:Rad52/Rad22 family DNA repair protein [Pseudolabrys sp.]MDP2294733.1 Rad52/Rad22 family DNA repair protein [Pseudolabrys sp.]
MGFSAKQLQSLRRNIDPRCVRKREVNGRELSYIEGWYAISEANRIFGFDAWSRETVETKCVLARETRGAFLAVYTARVRITVQADGAVIREGHGTGEGRGSSPGEVHDLALKAAETDATKRALATFGKPFGLALHGGAKQTSTAKGTARESASASKRAESAGAPDKSTSLRAQDALAGDRSPDSQLGDRPESEAPAVLLMPEPLRTKIDKSVLTISEPKRHRNKTHLRFVAAHSCLVCGRQPADAHHLRFAQPRALGLKVSDEFTVPLCREHHRQLHHAGNEIAWWHDVDIKPLPIAKGLWVESQMNEHATASLKT